MQEAQIMRELEKLDLEPLVREEIQKLLEQQVAALVERVVSPVIEKRCDELLSQRFQHWGRSNDRPKTLEAYLLLETTQYLKRPVNNRGNPLSKHSREDTQPRLQWIVEQYLERRLGEFIPQPDK